MICSGCGNRFPTVTRTWFDRESRRFLEVCNSADCGNLKPPTFHDVWVPKPYFDPNLGDENNPHGRMIESKGHKAKVLKELGLREDGDRYHGAIEKGIAQVKKKPKFKPEFQAKISRAVRDSIKQVIGRRA